jgi:hypothetical protein
MTLLIGAEYEGVLRWVERKADDGFQFLGELGIVADFERPCQVWLQAMFVPDPAHAFFTEARRLYHGARAPVGRICGLLLRGFVDHLLHFHWCDRWCSPWPRLIFISAAKPPSRNRFRQRAAFSGVIFSLDAIRFAQPYEAAAIVLPKSHHVTQVGPGASGSRLS